MKKLLTALVRSKRGSMDVAGAIISAGIAAIAVLLIVLVFYRVEVALPTTDLSAAGRTQVSNVVATSGSAFSLMPVVIIVIVAALVLSILLILRR